MATQNNWGNSVTLATTITLNGATVNVSSDAVAATVNLATGGAAKTIVLGSTNTTSKLDLKYGTADFSLASATGTVMTALDTGECTRPLQPACLTYPSNQINVTGDGTVATVTSANELFDQNADWATGTWTAPVTGKYLLSFFAFCYGVTSSCTSAYISITTSNRDYRGHFCNPAVVRNSTFSELQLSMTCLADMDSGDTAVIKIMMSGTSKVVDFGSTSATDPRSRVNAHLVC